MTDTPPPYDGPEIPDQEMVEVTPDELAELLSASGPGPRKRTARTALQVIVAVLLAVPGALAVLAEAGVNVPAGWTALVAGGTGALVLLVSAGQNAYDQHRGVG